MLSYGFEGAGLNRAPLPPTTAAIWGTVIAWEPARRVAFTWHPGREPESAQEVEVRFVTTEAGTRVELEHRGWERLGETARATRDSYDQGWDGVFGDCFRRAAEGPTPISPGTPPAQR
jgi:hypothetical protein